MKIRIVCYEDVHQWIIGKFALRMQEHLLQLGHEVSIAKTVEEDADVNHHLIYRGYNYERVKGVQTLMVTHVDSTKKASLLKKQLQVADMGICMSRETMKNLVHLGIERAKLSYVNPAHDGVIAPKKIIVGITTNVYNDGRKREYFIDKLAGHINKSCFEFRIMGEGWEEQVDILKKNGCDVVYSPKFDYNEYIQLILKLDYYLYMGMDEGQMGFVDAAAAGVKTIVTSQGFHLDAAEGITHGFRTFEELREIFYEIESQREKIIGSVSSWNWHDYTLKHLDIWNFLTAKSQGKEYKALLVNYNDGISSVSGFDKYQVSRDTLKGIKHYYNLFLGKLRHSHFGSKNKRKRLKQNK